MKEDNSKLISIIIPAYNEEKNVPLIFSALCKELKDYNIQTIFVDDGSQDSTLQELKHLADSNDSVKFISFSRNFGHQKAIMAGLNVAKGDIVISMDCDMQHPVEVIKELLKRWGEGYEIVHTIRKDKNTPFFKRLTGRFFYRLINILSDIPIQQGTADFRLLDKKVVTQLKTMNELHMFYRGIIPWVGYKSTEVEYFPENRVHGISKYTFMKMMSLALDGIISFSTKPLRLSIYFGLVIAILSFIYGIYAICATLFTQKVITGWGSTISVILFIGGFQFIVLGIIGEYIGRIYMENKNRPNYIIKETNIN
jgi:glycosyltransferase involved in cell wall biosynthesis